MNKLFALFICAFTLAGCVQVKQVGLYDHPADDANIPNINGFYSLSIFKDDMSDEIWFSPLPACLQISPTIDQHKEGDKSISIEWNKQACDYPWIGMGIGWNNWTGKNFSQIIDKAALSFWVKQKKGESVGLPWAVGFEDYSNSQAWTGVFPNFIKGGKVGEQWTQVIIPLSKFPFEQYDVSTDAIKQVSFQFESSGKVWIDEIRIVPYQSTENQTLVIQGNAVPVIDGRIADAEWDDAGLKLDYAKAHVTWDAENLYLAAVVEDDSPLINNQTGKDIWNGDAIEVAFSSESGLRNDRNFLYPSDRHIGIQMGGTNSVYDFSRQKNLDGCTIKTTKTSTGYIVEMALPWKSLGVDALADDLKYDFEFAVDIAGAEGVRKLQSRWNSKDKEGFNLKPSFWGSLIKQQKKYD